VSVAEHRAAAVVEDRTVAAEDPVAVVAAGIIKQSSVMFLVARKIWKWREAICGERR
jgi:phage head maturation protease